MLTTKKYGTMLNEYLTYPKLLCSLLHRSPNKGEYIKYGENSAQYITLRIPQNSKKHTLAVYIHGGGWRSGSPNTFAAVGNLLADQGFITTMLGYRKAPKYKYPCQIEDVCSALRKTIDILEQRNIKFEKIIVIGSSSGGHLGALLCLNKELHEKYSFQTDSIQGFCSLSGILSFDECLPNKSFNQLLRGLLERQSDYNIANPIAYITGTEKFCLLCLHGEKDPLVFMRGAEKFFDKFATKHELSKNFEIVKNKYHSDIAIGLFYFDNNERNILKKWLARFK